jgi:ornithine cyclodeaminase
VTGGTAASARSGFPAIIDGHLLRSLVPMADAIEASALAFTAIGLGELSSPMRSTLSNDRTLLMSAEHRSGSAVVKVITSVPDGWSTGRPSIEGSVLFIDGRTGRVDAILDAGALTALRTGAASGLATSLLATPDAAVLAMLGAGDQAADQIAGVRAVRPIREVRVFSRRHERSAGLCEVLSRGESGVTFTPVVSSREAVRGADVVCTATRSTSPLFELEDLKPVVHLNAVGAFRKEMCELPPAAFAHASVVVVDQLEAALAEAGDLIRALDAGLLRADSLVTVADLLSGSAGPPGGLSIFKSVGIAAQDWALADLVARRAESTP